jgi:adenine-specific DNA-methyltransferase
VLIDDLFRATKEHENDSGELTPDLFADFNGIPKGVDKTEFYQHDQNWSNRIILGDSLQVMASLAEREGLRGKVQCIYFDPPYGIKFNSNFQWSTTSRDVKDGKSDHITREPEQVKAFRDTWREGIHSYLTYLRDRLTVARDLLSESGSIFVQIGDENVHRVRALMDELFGERNCISEIIFQKTGGQTSEYLSSIQDYVLWYAKDIDQLKYRQPLQKKELGVGHGSGARYDQVDEDGNAFQLTSLTSNRPPGDFPVELHGKSYGPSGGYWKTGEDGFRLLIRSDRIRLAGRTLRYVRYIADFPAYEITNIWTDTAGSAGKIYVVQTSTAVVQRCILMATDPGDLVLVAEQWGRRWITIDTSRVALALARARIMGARYPFYLLADSRDGQMKEAEIARTAASTKAVHGNIRHGFVYERVPHITLKSIANNANLLPISRYVLPFRCIAIMSFSAARVAARFWRCSGAT